MKVKKKTVWIGQGTPADNLYAACQAYLKEHHGVAVGMGPIVVMHLPEDAKHTFYLAVKFTGTPPK